MAQARPVVMEVELHLPEGAQAAGLPELVAVRKGQHLSARAVRRSIERLWATGRFTDVVASQLQVEGGVRVVFTLSPVQQLAELVIEGNVVLTDERIRAASGLVERQSFDPDRLPAALAAIASAYRERGYDTAQISVAQEGVTGGVRLVLTVEEGVPTRVASVTVSGSPGLPMARLLDILGLRVGAALDRRELALGLERLREKLREERFYQARLGDPDIRVDGIDASVALPLLAGPRFSLHFHGNHFFPGRLLEAVLAYDGSEPLDATVAGRLGRRVEAFYRYRGFHDVRVKPREVRRPDGAEAVLAFDVEEGRQLVMRETRFEGNSAFTTETLRQALAEQVAARTPRPKGKLPLLDEPLELEGRGAPAGEAGPSLPDPSTVFVEEAYLAAAEVMKQAYRERGFLRAEVRFTGAELEVDRATGQARFEIDEGPQAHVREVRTLGSPVSLGPVTEVARGDPLNVEAVERGRVALVQSLGRAGYLFAKVGAQTTVEEGGTQASVEYRIEPGVRVRVGQIILQGLVRSDEEMVRDNLRIREGQVLDPESIFATQRSLVQLNIFRQVTVRLISPETVEPTKDVVVELRERPRLDGDVSGGYFLVDGPRVLLDTVYPNVDGRGINLAVRGKLNYVGWSAQVLNGRSTGIDLSQLQGLPGLGGRGNISVSQPRLYGLVPLDIGARLDLVGERVHRPSYIYTRFAAVTSLDWDAARWLSVSLQYELENDRVRPLGATDIPLSAADRARLRFPFGEFSLHSLRSIASIDFRDDPVDTRKGFLVTASTEFIRGLDVQPADSEGGPIPSFPINALKLAGSLSVYAPLGERMVLALSARAGTLRHLTAGARSIPPKRFFLGGATSMRGFREDGVIPQDTRERVHREVEGCVMEPDNCALKDAQDVLEGRALLSEGGELFTLGKAELRFPVYGAVDMGLFFETGNLWLDPSTYEVGTLRYVAGAGLRYGTPVGPLALDVGVNLDRDAVLNEPSAQVHFSIGLF